MTYHSNVLLNFVVKEEYLYKHCPASVVIHFPLHQLFLS